MNHEGDLLEKMIPGAAQVSGATDDDARIRAYESFADGSTRVLIIKPKIGAWGLNWQHCAHVVTFASHSYEQYYQSIRRCWRFGQKQSVHVDIICSEGERYVRENMQRKALAADHMFSELIRYMHDSKNFVRDTTSQKVQLPSWE
jgi:SNF2 family DNA or RNA helicase